MKIVVPTLLLILLFSCKSNSNKQESDTISIPEVVNSDTSLDMNYESPEAVDFLKENEKDSFLVEVNNEKLLITKAGKAFKGKKLAFDIKSATPIRLLYVQPFKRDYVVFYEYTDEKGVGSRAKLVSNKNKILWETQVGGFNLASPLIIGNYAYLSTFGFIGKLNLAEGKFIWKFENLGEKYESFEEPKFYKDSSVLFLHKASSTKLDSLLIDDKNGKMIRVSK
jgi:hypothetical protein